MADPFTVTIIGYIGTNLPHWLEDLRKTLFDKGKAIVGEKGREWLDEKEQERHLQQVLEKAVSRGLSNLETLQERDQYRDILTHLFEPGAPSDRLRHEVMKLLTLSGTPNI